MNGLLLEYARIVINVVFFALDVMGIKIAVSSYVRSCLLETVHDSLGVNPEARMAIETFISHFKAAWEKNDPWEMAKAIVQLIMDLQAFGLLWMIIESVVFKMSEWDRLMTGLGVSLTVTAALATGGLALVAQIACGILAAKSLIGLIMDVSKFPKG